MTKLTPKTRDQLKKVSTATLTTCLFKRGLRNQFLQDVHPLNPQAGSHGHRSLHARYIPARGSQPITVPGPRPSHARRSRNAARRRARHRHARRAASAGGILSPV
jgi:hypothetical protein